MDEAAQARRALDLDLRDALARGELEVLYQPLVDLSAGKISGCEALLRWHHPQRGLHSACGIHPRRRGDGLDHRARRLGHSAGLRGSGAVAGRHEGRRQPLAGAVQGSKPHQPRRRGTRPLRPFGEAARTRDHRDDHAAGQRGDALRDASAPDARRAHVPRRFRHRLFLAQLPAEIPVPEDQGRRLLRARPRKRRQRDRDHESSRRHGRKSRHGHRRRRRRDDGAARARAARGLP